MLFKPGVRGINACPPGDKCVMRKVNVHHNSHYVAWITTLNILFLIEPKPHSILK